MNRPIGADKFCVGRGREVARHTGSFSEISTISSGSAKTSGWSGDHAAVCAKRFPDRIAAVARPLLPGAAPGMIEAVGGRPEVYDPVSSLPRVPAGMSLSDV